MGHPSVYPTGTTIFKKDKAYGGYTIFPSAKGALLIDMEGNEVNLWAGLGGFPNKILPGGYVLGSTGTRESSKAYQDQLDLVQVDWNGKIVWRFAGTELIKDDGQPESWQARQHHDYQREGSPVGYYAPGLAPKADSGNTLILVHENLVNPKISDKLLIGDKIIEVNWAGEIVWQWHASEHFDEFGFDDAARRAIYKNPGLRGEAGGDWMHINSASKLGPNKWFDAGDERFNPENIIIDGRNTNTLNIIDHKTGRLVWCLGPDFNASEKTKKIGWIIGQHHFHMIPRGLPGEGDLLVFDNGGQGGYGAPNPASPDGVNNAVRDYSRVLQINPVSLEVVWKYTPEEGKHMLFSDGSKFYSPYISSAQRLPNGNTLITEGSDGRLIEVTPEHEIVWEYINPHYNEFSGGKFRNNMVYRAYRVPYEWVPQAARPNEKSIDKICPLGYRVPNASIGENTGKITLVEGVDPDQRLSTGMGSLKKGQAGQKNLDFCMVRLDTDE